MSVIGSITSARPGEPCGIPRIRHDLGRCDRQHASTKACWRRPHTGGARGMRSGISPQDRISRGWEVARLCSAVWGACHLGPPPDHAGVRGLPPGVADRRNRVDPISVFLPQSLFYFLPRAAPGPPQERRDLRTCCLPAFAILLLLGLTPREAVAARELYETI